MWNAPQDHKIIGDCLEAARKNAGLTQQELAKLLQKPQSFISAYESGQRRVDLLELFRIASALGADPQVLCRTIIGRLKDAMPGRRTRHPS